MSAAIKRRDHTDPDDDGERRRDSVDAPNAKSGYVRATRKTPAATIVAAWINALTGVGPSIASGNQTCSGNCPDLPTAPQKISSATTVIAGPSEAQAALESSRPAIIKEQRSASPIKPEHPEEESISPIRVVMNAFFAAAAALGFSIQKPISK